MSPIIVWIENDLRLADHAALVAAAESGRPVIPVFIWNGGMGWATGSASRWWLHHSIAAFAHSAGQVGLNLVIRTGDPETVLPALALESGAGGVLWLERPDTVRASRDNRIQKTLNAHGIEVRRYAGALLHDPDTVRTGSGGPYRVFTPFYRKFSDVVQPVPPPLPVPRFEHQADVRSPESEPLDGLGLLPEVPWYGGLADSWSPGEEGGAQAVDNLDALRDYTNSRDFPSQDGTSRLSPHLHFGEVSPRTVWHAAASNEPFRRQLVWREFAHHLIQHYPHTATEPLRSDFAAFPWKEDPDGLRKWQRGQTGYPIVDAGMRQLWHTGWMHNRVRMIVASFLTKDLLISWREGQKWFDDTLVDASLANNALGWQWAGGCGADAQPFFRIFNPVLQGKKFDPNGDYVRRWIPELREVQNRFIHEPWKAPDVPARYASPIVDHSVARDEALKAFATIRAAKKP